MIVNYNTKMISIKIVYYGCAMSGKTTSLKNLFQKLNHAEELTSIETTTGRTLFFDFGTLQFKGSGWAVKILLYSATGQDFYAATRPATLSGVDGIIFVVDSQKNYFDDNIKSWNELHYYFGDNIYKIPMVINLNKRDLENLIPINDIVEKFNLSQFLNIDIEETIAIKGQGVIESFKKLIGYIFPSVIIIR